MLQLQTISTPLIYFQAIKSMNEQNIFKNNNVTSNSAQLEILKKNFPNCFDKDGNFILDSFKDVIKENDLDFSEESYSLNWLGKSYAQLLRNEKAHTFIQPNHDHNNQKINKDSQNLLIKGDNLEVLKHLRNAYSEKIKMIYIDPPYNTGSDGFVYQDDRKFTKEELMQLAKVSEDEAKRILDFTAKGSNSHSAWLTFIYPRLYIARELLREDGVIFISIDDNEQAQLKLLCDEIFGEENFISGLTAILNLKGNYDNFGFSDTHEYVLVYSKNKNSTVLNHFNIEEEDISENWDEDDFGLYKRADTLRRTGQDASRDRRPKGFFPVFIDKQLNVYVTENDTPRNEEDIVLYPVNEKNEELSWSWGKKKITKEPHNLIVIDGRHGKNIYKKQRPALGDLPTQKPKTLFYKPDYSSSTATKQLEILLDGKIFAGPKPIPLIYDLVLIGSDQQAIILDFFAGSGTTAHAVMDLNTEDNGNRQFILVQLPEMLNPEKTEDKTSYNFCVDNELEPTIFSITKARIEKAGEKIKQENPEYAGDLGFKIFETAPLPNHYNNEILELNAESQLEMFDGAKNDELLLDAILTTWTLYDRIPLTSSLEALLIDAYKAQYSVEYNTLYLMRSNFTTANIKTLINKIETDPKFVPKKIVVYGFNFDSKIQRELDEALRSYQNKKSLNIDLLVRYY